MRLEQDRLREDQLDWDRRVSAASTFTEGKTHAQRLKTYLNSKLGKPSGKGAVISYKRDLYTLKVEAKGEAHRFTLEVHQDDHADALDQLLWDADVWYLPISLEERRAYIQKGRDLAAQLAPRSKEASELKKLVQGICDGQVYTSAQCPGMESMVFMPLLFGGLTASPSEDAPEQVRKEYEALMILRDEPTELEAPPSPSAPQEPSYPAKPEAIPYDPREIEKRRNLGETKPGVDGLFEINEEAILEYTQEIDNLNAQTQQEYERQVAALDQKWAQDQEAYSFSLGKWLAAKRRWEDGTRRFKEDHQEWLREAERVHAAQDGCLQQSLANVGVIYEWLSAALPRSVNGHPIFASMYLLNKSDWDRVRNAVIKELKRREDLEL